MDEYVDMATLPECYVTITCRELKDPDEFFKRQGQNFELIEGKHYANIKCRIIRTEIQKFNSGKEGQFMCIAQLEPLDWEKQRPEWYDEDNMGDDFYEVPIHTLYDNTFWLPINHGKTHYYM
jgi:hypothetical protein